MSDDDILRLKLPQDLLAEIEELAVRYQVSTQEMMVRLLNQVVYHTGLSRLPLPQGLLAQVEELARQIQVPTEAMLVRLLQNALASSGRPQSVTGERPQD